MRNQAKCRGHTSQARRLANEGNLAQAYQQLKQASRLAVNKTLKQQVDNAGSTVSRAAEQMLAEADEQYDNGEFVEALGTYQAISRMGRLPGNVAAQAGQKLNAAKRDPALRTQRQDIVAARRFELVEQLQAQIVPEACQAPDEIAAFTDAELYTKLVLADQGKCRETCPGTGGAERAARNLANQVKIVDKLDSITKLYGDTPTGQKSALLLQDLLADPDVASEWKRQREENEARLSFHLAILYKQGGNYGRAGEELRNLIDSYPDNQWADKARLVLPQVESLLNKRI